MASHRFYAAQLRRLEIARNAYSKGHYNFSMKVLKQLIDQHSHKGFNRKRDLEFSAEFENGDRREAFRILGSWAKDALDEIKPLDWD